jgi:hypothetical protein
MFARKLLIATWHLPVLTALALAVCAFNMDGLAQQRVIEMPLTEPHVMRENFQGDGLGQWASYPPAQDIGYEPSISPTSAYDAPGGRALMRVVQPTRAGAMRFGFIKKVQMAASESGKLSFNYRLNSPSTGNIIEIGLAGADGRLYQTRVPARANGWTAAEVLLRDLHSADGQALAPNVGIEAICIVSDLESADPDTTYRFMIDDVALAAAREARFEVRAPQTIAIEPWKSLAGASSYRAGDPIKIEAAAPARLTRAECTLLTQDSRAVITQSLYDDGTHGDQHAGDGVWSNDSVYTLRPSDPTGVWVARLHGTTADGRSLTTPVRLILHRSDMMSHPRLFFSARDRETLIARTRDPRMAALWSKLEEKAKATRSGGDLAYGDEVFPLLDREHLLPTLLGYFNIVGRARERISYNALVAYVTGSEEARAAAKTAMLEVARWRRWAPPWFEAHGQQTYYPAGELSADVAFGYDLLYDQLSEVEREQIRRALIERSIIPTYREYVLDNRAMANTSNWISHTVSGALIAAAAIANDGTAAESGGRFETYLNGLLFKLENHMDASFLPDGSYGEGISYQEFDLETLAPAMIALDRVLGVDYFPRTFVKDSYMFPLYTLAHPTSESPDMGDTHSPSGRTLAPLVYKSKDPTFHWFYRQFDHASIIDFLFFDDSVEPKLPALPTSRIFANKGNAVFRTGWGADDAVLLFRAGPTFNHNHNDQGSFLLTAFGETLISEAGWSDYYKDPYYATFFTKAIGHNTVLVDGNPESQAIADTPQFAALNSYPRMTDWITSEFHDAVGSDLSPVYRGRLDRYTRRIIYVKPHYFVVYDDLAAKGTPARFDWLLHLPDRARIETSKGLVTYTGQKAGLAVRSFASGDTELRLRNGHIPYPVFATGTPTTLPPQPAFLDIQTTTPTSATQFMVALIPAKTVENAKALAGRMSEVIDDKWVGLRVERDSEHDLVMFRRGGTSGEARSGEWSTDSAAWTVTREDERIKMLAVQGARVFKQGGRTLLASELPISLAVDYRTGAIELAEYAAAPTKLRIFLGAPPVSVQLDGHNPAPESVNYSSADGTVTIELPVGQHRLSFIHR